MKLHSKKPVSVEEMTALEDLGVELGLSNLVMMENAGAFIARFVVTELASTASYSSNEKYKVLLIAGVGNNGGDCFVAARHLAYYSDDIETVLVLVGEPDKIKAEEAATNFQILSRIPQIELFFVNSVDGIAKVSSVLSRSDAVIVGLFGTGFRGLLRPFHSEVIETINSSGVQNVLSVDLPSGLNATTGAAANAIRSTVTLTMHAPKLAMVGDAQSREICGKIVVANIGLPF